MPKRVRLTEQKRLSDAIVAEMAEMETAIDMLFTASHHLNKITGKVPPVWKSLGKSVDSWFSSLQDLSATYDHLYKEFGKHFPL